MKAIFKIINNEVGSSLLILDGIAWLKGERIPDNVLCYYKLREPNNILEIVPSVDELISLYDHSPDLSNSHEDKGFCVRTCKYCKRTFHFSMSGNEIKIPSSVYISCL